MQTSADENREIQSFVTRQQYLQYKFHKHEGLSMLAIIKSEQGTNIYKTNKKYDQYFANCLLTWENKCLSSFSY